MERDGNFGGCAGIWSPNVVVFGDELVEECAVLEKREWVGGGLVSVAALACPPVVKDEDGKKAGRGEMRLKLDKDVEAIRARGKDGVENECKGGKDCACAGSNWVWKCPPSQVAEILEECLDESEFEGWFEKVVRGIYDREVCAVWREVLKETV